MKKNKFLVMMKLRFLICSVFMKYIGGQKNSNTK